MKVFLHSSSAAEVRCAMRDLLCEFFRKGKAWKVDWRGNVKEECELADFDTLCLGVLAFNLVSLRYLPIKWLYNDLLPKDHKEEFQETWIGISQLALESMPDLVPLASCLNLKRERRPSLLTLAIMLGLLEEKEE